ncbi:guanylyl cyclase-activating protein 2-like [Seriola lalandi dorsalis]|uniref:Guanylyl cyclase-activating protein 2-like n=1 Tax=Seriola lalandi dorsalis TaxID=1841481 RepID=A0A3B4WL81_SERLL|nr:guanylyl cyclase-activating protein 2-like [Seriola lalandi dorsalis]
MGQNQQKQIEEEELELNSIQDLYKSFIKECPSGSLYLHEFKRMFGVQNGTPESQYMDSIFRAFDMNHDNTMDFIEYVAALHLVLRGKLEDKLRWSFKVFDNDDNGRLDRHELLKIVKIIYKIKKGSVSDEAGKPSLTPAEVCDRIFREVDDNSDGQITLDEFVQGAQRSPWLQSFLRLDVNPSGWVQRYLCDRKLMSSKSS